MPAMPKKGLQNSVIQWRMQHFSPYISEALFEPEQWEIEQFLGGGATMKIEVALEIHSIKKPSEVLFLSGLKSRQMVCSKKIRMSRDLCTISSSGKKEKGNIL